MATVTKNRTYDKIAGFLVISQKPLMISEIWHGGKNDQHSKIYLPCNFEVNLITLSLIVLTYKTKSIKILKFDEKREITPK
jgi:hypothetical protein